MSKYRVALIGAGQRAKAHARAYSLVDNAEVCACTSRGAESSALMAKEFGIRAYGDVAAMLEAEHPDLVHITTPPSVRIEPMQLVSDFGVPAATVEKPIAIDVADWRGLVALERTSRTKFAISHQFRWYPGLVRCREALSSGALGNILLLEGTAGMSVANQGTHALHYAASLAGDRPVVSAFGAAAGWETDDKSHPGPKDTLGLLQLDNGVRMHWNVGPSAPRVGDPSTTWQHVRVAAHAEQGHVIWEEFGRWEILGPNGRETGEFPGFDEWGRLNGVAQAAFHREMLDWIEDSARAPATNLHRSLHEWKVVLAVYASALNNTRVDLRDFEPDDDLIDRLRNRLSQ